MSKSDPVMRSTFSRTVLALPLAALSLLAAPAADAKGRASGHACLVPAAAEIDFGPTPVKGRAAGELVLQNVCRATVWVSSLNVTPAAFGTSGSAPFRVPARQSFALPMHFTPGDTGAFQGEVTLKGAHRQSLRVALRGKGAPGSLVSDRFEVTPAFFNETLPAGHMAGRTLSVRNTSRDSLGIWFQSAVEAPGTGGDTAGPRLSVFYLAEESPGWIRDFEWILRSPPTVDSVSLVPFGEGRTPGLDKLLAYDMVVVSGTPDWAHPDSLGDVLADYVDQGGKLVLMHYALSTTPWGLGGRIVGPDYAPVMKSGDGGSSYTRNFADHPLVEGVEWFGSNSIVAATEVQGAGRPLGHYYQGSFLAMAYNPNKPIVFLNLVPHDGEYFGISNLYRLFANIADHFQGTHNWLKVPTPYQEYIHLGPGETLNVLVPVGHYRSLRAGKHHGYIRVVDGRFGGQVRVPAALNVTAP